MNPLGQIDGVNPGPQGPPIGESVQGGDWQGPSLDINNGQHGGGIGGVNTNIASMACGNASIRVLGGSENRPWINTSSIGGGGVGDDGDVDGDGRVWVGVSNGVVEGEGLGLALDGNAVDEVGGRSSSWSSSTPNILPSCLSSISTSPPTNQSPSTSNCISPLLLHQQHLEPRYPKRPSLNRSLPYIPCPPPTAPSGYIFLPLVSDYPGSPSRFAPPTPVALAGRRNTVCGVVPSPHSNLAVEELATSSVIGTLAAPASHPTFLASPGPATIPSPQREISSPPTSGLFWLPTPPPTADVHLADVHTFEHALAHVEHATVTPMEQPSMPVTDLSSPCDGVPDTQVPVDLLPPEAQASRSIPIPMTSSPLSPASPWSPTLATPPGSQMPSQADEYRPWTTESDLGQSSLEVQM